MTRRPLAAMARAALGIWLAASAAQVTPATATVLEEEGTELVFVLADVDDSAQAPGLPTRHILELEQVEADPHRFEISVPGRIRLPLANGSWRARLATDLAWIEPRLELGSALSSTPDSDSPARGERTIVVYPAAPVTATFRSRADRGRGEPDPVDPSTPDLSTPDPSTSVLLRFEPSGAPSSRSARSPSLAGAEVACTRTDEEQTRCTVPLGVHDLRFEVEGHAPVYRWHVVLEASLDLGRIAVHPGASVSGWISTTDDGRTSPGGAARSTPIRLEARARLAARDLAPDEERRAAFRRHETQADERGFFQLAGLAEGSYDLLAHFPGQAPSLLPEVSVIGTEEVDVGEVEWSPPARLELELDPPTDPYGKPWRIRAYFPLGEQIGLQPNRFEGVVGEEGLWMLDDLVPGTYDLELLDSRGHRWRFDQLALPSGFTRHSLDTPFERFEGQLLLAGDAVKRARVTLRERQGNMQVRTSSGDEGRFFVFLRRDRLWEVEVEHGAERILTRLPPFAVPERGAGERWPRKVFDLPDTRLFGEVVGPDGQPTDLPIVLVLDHLDPDSEIWLSRHVPRDGFSFRGLQPGRWRVSAGYDRSSTPRRARSVPLEIDLVRGGEVGPLRLQLEESRRLEGQVLSPAGAPVAGARLFAGLESAPGQSLAATVPMATSEADGVFRLDLPARARRMLVTVLAPGFSLAQVPHHLPASPSQEPEPLLIHLDPPGGSVSVVYEDADGHAADDREQLRRRTFLYSTADFPGRALGPALLGLWTDLHPAGPQSSGWRVPALGPGPYRACLLLPEIRPFLVGHLPIPDALLTAACGGERWLTPGGGLELEVPGRALERFGRPRDDR